MNSAARPRRRDATAVLLTRGHHGDTEVFLVERSKKLRFFGGYLALPGGVMDPQEAALGAPDAGLACAHRELFEETGVLVPPLPDKIPAESRHRIRQALLEGSPRLWGALVDEHGLPALAELCRITTPPFAPVRYATIFYHAALPPCETPDIWPGELTGGEFWRPGDALEAWARGEVQIVPPVLLLLDLLDGTSFDEFAERLREETLALERGRLHPVRFTPGIFMAALETPTKPPATTTNTFLVGEQSIWIIDPSPIDEDEQERLFERIDAAIAGRATVEGVLLTHQHPDHVGAVQAVCDRYDVAVGAHAAALEQLTHLDVRTHAIDDGDTFELGVAPDGSDGWQLRAVWTPGHTTGHLAFVESRYRAAIVGDLLSTLSTVVIDPAEGHMRTYLESLERLLAEDPGTIYPGHGPAFRDGPALLRRTLEHRRAREQKIVAALSDTARAVDDVLRVVYDDVDEKLYPLARLSLVAGLIKLEEDGLAQRAGQWWIRRRVH